VGNIRNEESLVGDLNGFEKLALLQVRFIVEVLLGVSSVKGESQGKLALLVPGVASGKGPGSVPGSEADLIAFLSLVFEDAFLMV
jgi:hypothetical protein